MNDGVAPVRCMYARFEGWEKEVKCGLDVTFVHLNMFVGGVLLRHATWN